MKKVSPGFGDFYIKYPTKSGFGFLYIILSPPNRRYKGKKKDVDKLLNKSAKSNRVIAPKDIDEIIRYLYQNFPKIIKSRNEILSKIEEIIAGLRLELHVFHNLRFQFKDPTKSEIIVFENSNNGEFHAYINLVGMEEKGLILAYERQINYIRENLKKGIHPLKLKSLPPLRTGETDVDFSKSKSSSKATREKPKESDLVQKFREKIKQKKIQGEVDEELAFETVIDFSNKGRAAISFKNEAEIDNTSQISDEIASSDVIQNAETKMLKDAINDETKMVGNTKYSNDQTVSNQNMHLNATTPSNIPIPTKPSQPNLSPIPENAIPIIDSPPFINIPKPAPLSRESVISIPDNRIEKGDLAKQNIQLNHNNKDIPFSIDSSAPPPLSLEEGVKLSSKITFDEYQQIQEERDLLKNQLEQVTDELTKQIQSRDEKIKELDKNLSILHNKNKELEDKYNQIQKETQIKMKNFRDKFLKIQEKIQPLIKENQELKLKWEKEVHTKKVTDNIQLINQNLSLQEEIDKLKNVNEKLIKKLNEQEQLIKRLSESKQNQEISKNKNENIQNDQEKKETAQILKNALMNSLQEKQKQLQHQQQLGQNNKEVNNKSKKNNEN
ncbi:MAG: hypothetical protein K9W44_15745 [Candidatus Lokiarchaeota archaeon]|nr:hypothetical protein [Candidatus Harpocratesius repetitus]